jgi:hypothetical protein
MKNFKKQISALLLSTALAGCNYLGQMPDDRQYLDHVWANRVKLESYLYSIYSNIPSEECDWRLSCPWTWASDEVAVNWMTPGPQYWSPGSDTYTQWGLYYKGIRSSFVFENNVDKCPELSPREKEQYRCEVKFLRGYFYWKLLQQYGPFVLLEREIGFEEDWRNFTRAPYDTCVEYICRMMDEAGGHLPWKWEGDNKKWLGKPTKFACLAVKAEVLHMAASPQWNGNKEYSDFTNKDGSPLVDTEYKRQKWEAAARAALAVIRAAEENPQYGVKLYRNNEQDNGSTFNPYLSVRYVQLSRWNCEILWARTDDRTLEWAQNVTPSPGGFGNIGPTQRMVDAFYMIDGKTIEDSNLYSENGFATTNHPNWKEDDIDKMRSGEIWGHRAGEHNMFANREARFYNSILYNGRPIPLADPFGQKNIYSSRENADGWARVELYAQGVSGLGRRAGKSGSRTGHLVMKNAYSDAPPFRPHIFIRLAGVYLNYIEALNEYTPAHPDIEKYWNLIRSRAGLPGIFECYPEIAGNRERQLELILRERQVELCFENDRYFTTRRRWIAHLTDNSRAENRRMFGDGGSMWGLNVSEGAGLWDISFYRRTKVEDRVFEKRLYLFPIPQSEIDKNVRIVQNPWW